MDISNIINNTHNLPIPFTDQIQLDAGSDLLTSMVVSDQGLLVLGDSGGFVHQWSCSNNIKVNQNSEPLWTNNNNYSTTINPSPLTTITPTSVQHNTKSDPNNSCTANLDVNNINSNNNNYNNNNNNNNKNNNSENNENEITIPSEPPTPSIQVDDLLTNDYGLTIPRCAIPDYENGFLSDEMFESQSEIAKT